MEIIISSRILASIARDIAARKPAWALMRANEYLLSDSALHRALARKAEAALSHMACMDPRYARTMRSLLDGARASAIDRSALMQLCAWERSQAAAQRQRYLPKHRPPHAERKQKLKLLRAA